MANKQSDVRAAFHKIKTDDKDLRFMPNLPYDKIKRGIDAARLAGLTMIEIDTNYVIIVGASSVNVMSNKDIKLAANELSSGKEIVLNDVLFDSKAYRNIYLDGVKAMNYRNEKESIMHMADVKAQEIIFDGLIYSKIRNLSNSFIACTFDKIDMTALKLDDAMTFAGMFGSTYVGTLDISNITFGEKNNAKECVIDRMFQLAKIGNLNIRKIGSNKTKSAVAAFSGARIVKHNIEEIELGNYNHIKHNGWIKSGDVNAREMFNNCTMAFDTINSIKLGRGVDAESLFRNCDCIGLNTAAIEGQPTNLKTAFYGGDIDHILDVVFTEKFDTQWVDNATAMFKGRRVRRLDIRHFKFNKEIGAYDMFSVFVGYNDTIEVVLDNVEQTMHAPFKDLVSYSKAFNISYVNSKKLSKCMYCFGTVANGVCTCCKRKVG